MSESSAFINKTANEFFPFIYIYLYPFIFLVCIYTHVCVYIHTKVHNVIKNSAIPRSHSNLHQSIERTQIDRWTLWKNENLSPIRGDIFLWSSRLPWSPPKFVMLATKCANFTGRFLHRQYISGKSDHCYWKNRQWGARLVYKIIFPTSFDICFWSSNFVE